MSEEAALWLEKLERATTADDIRGLRRWLKVRAHRQIIVDRCKRWHGPEILAVLGELIPADAYAEERTERRYDRMLIAIVFGVSALSLTTVLVAMTRVWSHSEPQRALARSEAVFETADGERKSITLPDSSVIVMNEASRLLVGFIPQRREVFMLKGEATIEVREDPHRPFMVYAGPRQFGVTAGSAEFCIARLTAENASLIVASGEVDVPETRASAALSAALIRQQVSSGGHKFSKNEIGSIGPSWFTSAMVQSEEIERRLAWTRNLDLHCVTQSGTVGSYRVCTTTSDTLSNTFN